MLATILLPVILFAVMIAAFIFIPRFMVRRAMGKVIACFRKHNALKAENAKTQGELGLNPLGFFQRMAAPRDYKPTALKVLANAGAILSTPEGKMYLVEEKLNELSPSISGS